MKNVLRTFGLLVAVCSTLEADPNVYVHATDPGCLGNTPCFSTMVNALQNVDDGGTVSILSDISSNILDTEGRRDITVQGVPSTILLSTQIQIMQPVRGWTVKDLSVSGPFVIEDVVDSLTVDNVTANVIRVGDVTQNPNADITIRNSTVRNGGPITVAGSPGITVSGSIVMEGNTCGSVNVKVRAIAGVTTRLNSTVEILDNTLETGGLVTIVGETTAGAGVLAGLVEFSRNTGSNSDSKFGVTMFGNVTGDITGHVIFRDNELNWLALLTTGSTAGAVNRFTMTGNVIEVLEIVAQNRSVNGPALVDDNQVIDLGGASGLDNPLFLLEGDGVGNVTVTNNVMPEADLVVRAYDGIFVGPATITGNSAGLLTLDSQDGDFTSPFEVSGNFLPTSADPRLSRLTIRSTGGGDSQGGEVIGNTMDELTINFDGFLRNDLVTMGNTVREQTNMLASGNLGGATHTVSGNDFLGDTTFNGLDATVQFNRLVGDLGVISGTSVDGTLNWWGCNEGPGEPGCSEDLAASFPVSPWLTFSADSGCEGANAVAHVDLLTASNGATPSGNVTPASVGVTSSDGTVLENPVVLVNGAGCTNIDVNGGVNMPTVRMQLDSEVIFATGNCSAGTTLPPCAIFADGFESGTTDRWTSSIPSGPEDHPLVRQLEVD